MFSEKWEHVYFRSFHALSESFVRYKTQQNMKINDFSTFLVCNFSLFIFSSTFLYSLLRTDEKCFLRSGNMFFSEVFMSEVKISYRTKHKKHEKNTIFRLFWFTTFHFSFFFQNFFIQCLELMKSVF